MTDMQTALKTAGLKKTPLNRRVWQMLKDSKNAHSCIELTNILHESKTRVSQSLLNLYERSMVTREKRYGKHSWKNVYEYTANGSVYELLPKKRLESPTITVFRSEPVATPANRIEVNKLTLLEAHALYKQLKEYFSC